MSRVRDPLIEPVEIAKLRPTQITVGMREVRERRAHWRQLRKPERSIFLEQHMIPVILGPKGRYYIVDHHHLTRALHDEGVKRVFVSTFEDLAKLDNDTFWFVLDSHGWMHPFDTDGERRPHGHIPKSIDKLKDDPYRSLAGGLRRLGGYAKDTSPFSEFLWADFLRRRIKPAALKSEKGFQAALKKANALAKSRDADYLPGWCGPVDPS
jgi:hypothetical protein